MAGRGFNLLLANSTISQQSSDSGGDHTNDSGLGSRSPVALGRGGRGIVIDDVQTTLTNLSMGGRGRASFIESISTENSSVLGRGISTESNTNLSNESGQTRGRGLLLQCLGSLTTGDCNIFY